ncbi:MAG TPA: dihydroorotase [bacterium]|nr:dihydroorotase [bacterium]
MAILLTNGRVFQNDGFKDVQVLVSEGKIEAIGHNILTDADRIDLDNKFLLPGVIDMHVHFREPGGEHKETWATGSHAAVLGGVTTVLDMPNTNPATTTLAAYVAKRELAAANSLVNFGLAFGAGPDNREEQRQLPLTIPVKCYAGPTTGSLLVDQLPLLDNIFATTDHLFLIHAEDKEVMDRNAMHYPGSEDPRVHNKIRSPEAAVVMMEKIAGLARKYDRRVHFCHISSQEELEFVKALKAEGLKMTCEVTPHHLFLEEEALARIGNYAKMNPPIRSQEHLDALWEGLVQGAIDCVATDHAPHTRSEKELPYSKAPAGVPGVQTMLPLLLEQIQAGRLSYERLVEITSAQPATILGLQHKGRIAVGYDADLVAVDPTIEREITNAAMASKCGWSPFAGRHVHGWPVMTMVGGQIACREGRLDSDTRGKFIF